MNAKYEEIIFLRLVNLVELHIGDRKKTKYLVISRILSFLSSAEYFSQQNNLAVLTYLTYFN